MGDTIFKRFNQGGSPTGDIPASQVKFTDNEDAQTKVTALEQNVDTLQTTVAGHATAITELQAEIDSFIGAQTNFVGIVASTSALPTVTSPSWGLVGTDIDALNAYVYNGSAWAEFGTKTYDFTDFSDVKTQLTELEQKASGAYLKSNTMYPMVVGQQEEHQNVPLTIRVIDGSNGWWNVSGDWYADNSRRSTEKIDVVAGEKYLATIRIGSSTAMAYLAQWNGNTWVGVAEGFIGGSGNAVDREYIVPNGVTKIALTSYDSTEPSLKKVIVNDVPNFYSKQESDARYALAEAGVMKKYGVKWSISNMEDLGQRCFDAIGLNATIGIGNTNGVSDFDNIYPWSQMKRCNINTNANGAKIVTFEGQTGFALDGSNGDVFVRIPKFCIDKYIEDGYEYRVISSMGNVHPAFIENGKELDEIFVGAFEASIINDVMYSRSGIIPANNMTPIDALAAATGKGVKYTLYDMRCVDAIWSLMAVEYGCRNSNQILGWGYSDYMQPVDDSICGVSLAASQTNSVQLGVAYDNSQRILYLNMFHVGGNITICENTQGNIIAQRKITNVVCNAVGDNVVITFDGTPLDVNTNMFVGNAPCNTNYCETLGDSYKLNWHTGRANWQPLGGVEQLAETMNPCRYRWIENPVGNVWHFLPDISFNNLQMYVCDNMKDYVIGKYTTPYRPVGDLLPKQDNNGAKSDINTVANPNFWVTSLLDDMFAKGVTFGKTFDTIHDGSITSKKGFGAYYYLDTGNEIIVNGGGFDHLWRSNILTMRAWIETTESWYLYGARLMFKNID